MKINHLNHFGTGAEIYCEKQKSVVTADQDFVDSNCAECPMFNGSLQGAGIECLYEDSLFDTDGRPFVHIKDPIEFAEKRYNLFKHKHKRNS